MGNGPVIVLDPGHGGHDSGAVGHGKTEAALVLAIGLATQRALQKYHCMPVMTRDTDVFVTLTARAKFSNARKTEAFVSLHANASDNIQANGIEVFTSKGDTKADDLASLLFEEVSDVTEQRRRVDMSDGDVDKEANFAVLRHTKAPSALFEFGFITNQLECKTMHERVEAYASAVALALVRFLKLSPLTDKAPLGDKPEHVATHAANAATLDAINHLERRFAAEIIILKKKLLS
jgi:N-acetylmuramoyl-L-alanine amidase